MAMFKKEDEILILANGEIQHVLHKIVEDESVLTRLGSNGRMLIHWAASAGNTELIYHLMFLKSPVDPTDNKEKTPLMLAAACGCIDVVRLLIDAGAYIDSQSTEGNSTLHYAVYNNWNHVVKLLLDEGASANLTDHRGMSPLHIAVSTNHLSTVKLLLSCENIDINIQDSEGNTPLHVCCEERMGEMATLLVKRGASLDTLNKKNKTPLNSGGVAMSYLLRSLV